MKRKVSIKQRLKEPTPRFFKKVFRAGVTIGAIGTALLLLPLSLPTAVITAAGYMVSVGVATAAIAKTTSENENQIQ